MDKKWYVLGVYSGSEYDVERMIMEEVRANDLEDQIERILIPSQKVTHKRRGKEYESERKFFPGHLFIKMEMNDATWHLVTNQPRTMELLGGKTKPTPISEAEAGRVIKLHQEGLENNEVKIIFTVGEKVKILEGPFATFVGEVENVNANKKRLKVLVTVFKQGTHIELNYDQVEKVEVKA